MGGLDVDRSKVQYIMRSHLVSIYLMLCSPGSYDVLIDLTPVLKISESVLLAIDSLALCKGHFVDDVQSSP
jgi:hypothetical protein